MRKIVRLKPHGAFRRVGDRPSRPLFLLQPCPDYAWKGLFRSEQPWKGLFRSEQVRGAGVRTALSLTTSTLTWASTPLEGGVLVDDGYAVVFDDATQAGPVPLPDRAELPPAVEMIELA